MIHPKIIISLLLLLCHCSFAEFRIWEDAKGNIWEGEFVTMNGGKVVIRNHAGDKLECNPTTLVDADQEYLEKVVPPKLSLEVTKTTDNSGVGSNSEKVRCHAGIKQVDTIQYTGELTAVLVTMGEDIRTGASSKVSSTEYTFSLPKAKGEQIEFKGDKNTFIRKANKSGRLYSGYILVVWDRFGNPIAIKSNRDSFVEKATSLARPKRRQTT